ncbi:MAG: DNA cytosine methyltransferase [Microcoleus sp. PH2017_22_RUC_O_B]|uniref:DNA cytosine methyltransferase n=1 Tax=unclassified Microcoleus TaxID=2642155 RepID=UPI001D3A0378|nr:MULTISPECIES: DNA cytosine methyltransferase [unclassified Microcoleus]MCC3527342.1 DNA cytosine methyltransferase [Microcoleus sp. PH2017_21_RUC_O_A]MCC3539465.1 DNA cytosine methyltransferase [Microcoleus sp. PH2017_22_RUC_O_B]
MPNSQCPIPCIFSFFSGSGFLDLGFELNGFHVVYVNEIFSPFMQAYRYSRQCLNLPLPEYGHCEGEAADVTRLVEGKPASRLRELMQDARQHHDIIGFIAGPPCPDFSIGGKNRGGEGDKGKLSASYIELICQQQPDFFLFENVKGLWRTKKHKAFYDELKLKFADAGYVFVERLINAIEYGVPQDRDRIILIGFHKHLVKDRGICLDKNSQMLPQGLFPWSSQILYPKSEVFSNPWPETDAFACDSWLPCPDGISKELTVQFWFQKNDVVNHPNSEHYFQPRAGIKRFAAVDEGDDSKKSYKRLHRWRYSPTACYGNNEVHLHPYKVRRLSVAETLAVQSLPKEFALPANMTLTNMFKTVGNGVPYLAAQAIAKTILYFLDNSFQASHIPEFLKKSEI